jgi:hypothetical protein
MPEPARLACRPAMRGALRSEARKTIDERVTAAELRLGQGDEERWNTYV